MRNNNNRETKGISRKLYEEFQKIRATIILATENNYSSFGFPGGNCCASEILTELKSLKKFIDGWVINYERREQDESDGMPQERKNEEMQIVLDELKNQKNSFIKKQMPTTKEK